MKNFKINTIVDSQGFKKVYTCDGVSKVWFGKWYIFNREIKQAQNFDVIEIQAEGFNHAKDLFDFKNYKNASLKENQNLRLKLNLLESKIISKYGKKLKGKAHKSKLNSFLR